MRIGVDLMGSDSSPAILFEAILQAAKQLEGINLAVFATQSVIDSLWSMSEVRTFLIQTTSRIEFQVTPEVIEMGDEPLVAIRQKKNSSLIVGIKLLRKRLLDAFVSAGNTGALIASATLSLPLLPGIKRPALLATLPTEKGSVVVIDVGGNVSCKAQHLVQFAQMGAAYQRCSQKTAIPKVGLLNIGVESKKGTSEVRQAYQILQEKMTLYGPDNQKMHFIGNIEGREVFQGKVDVLVTDGFTGNVFLKTSEGASSFILDHLKQALKEVNPQQRQAIFSYLQRHFDYQEYPGAILCGIDHIVIKCHGKSSAKSLLNGILRAADLVKSDFLVQVKQQLSI